MNLKNISENRIKYRKIEEKEWEVQYLNNKSSQRNNRENKVI